MPWIGEDHSGMVFGNWTVLQRDLSCKRPKKYFCRCKCGNIHSKLIQNLKRRLSTQCIVCAALSYSHEMIGKKYNFLTVMAIEKINNKCSARTRCDCGNEKILCPSHLKTGTYKSCGKCDLNKKNKSISKVGSKKGMLTIITHYEDKTFLAKCDCGQTKRIRLHHLQTNFPSCGCYIKEKNIKNAEKYVGMKWGYLKVIKFLGMTGEISKTRATYLLKCKCGNELIKGIGHMFDIRSCGCLHKISVPKGSKVHSARTNEIEVSTIRDLFSSGLYTRKELSEMMQLNYSHICRLLKKEKNWTHV